MKSKQSPTNQDECGRIAAARQVQGEEAKRKQREFDGSPEGMRKILEDAMSKVRAIDQQARDRSQMTASWTDARGNLRRQTGASFSLDVDVLKSPDLFVRSNQKFVNNIIRACWRPMKVLQDLVDTLGTNAKAMPPNLKEYMDRLVSEIPSLDTIRLEVTHGPKQGAPGAAKGPAKV